MSKIDSSASTLVEQSTCIPKFEGSNRAAAGAERRK